MQYNSGKSEEGVTYTFEAPQNRKNSGEWLSFCASLTCIPFGLMLGWPSHTYPLLLDATSPIPITMNQSAMIAGFLLFGVAFGTMVNTVQIGPTPKLGVVLGNVFILIGWVLMWQSKDMRWLLASRMTLGIGHGYAMGQVKKYIAGVGGDVKLVNFYGLFGFVLAYFIGPFVGFRMYGVVCCAVSGMVFFIVIFLPGFVDRTKVAGYAMSKILRDGKLRVNFFKLTVLLVCQQYCGAPPTLVYTQILFKKFGVGHVDSLALIYAVLFYLCNFLGVYVTPKFNKRAVLLMSSSGVLLLLLSEICVIYFKVDELYFSHTSVIILYLFIIVHTVGIGSVPFSLIEDFFPPQYRGFVINYFVALFSILALTITKIFQVLITNFPLYLPFCLFSTVTIFAIVFILFFVNDEPEKLAEEEMAVKV